MRVLGLDLGAKRIGVAISDADGEFAFPIDPLQRKGHHQALKALCALIRERTVERVVVGLPIHMDGREGEEAQRARSFADALSAASGLVVDTLDERWTSIEAQRVVREFPSRGRRRDGTVDSVAASILLRTYLELQRRSEASEGGDQG